jgi:uncharacterized protein YbbK (DUF523 family)/uncharacterized protein YbgA (DUF1722 family)
MSSKPKLAVSSCLLGQRVRYNGDAAEFRTLTRVWGEYLDLVGVCPEVGIGMGTPRPTIRLVKSDGKVSLVNPKSGEDFTEKMIEFAEVKSDYLVSEGICGFVFKRGSPSCGLERVKVYKDDNPTAKRDGMGLFTKVFTTLYPHIPVIEEGRLTDPLQAEHFLSRVHFFSDWLAIGNEGWTASKIMKFHSENKLFLLSKAPASKRILGRLIADGCDAGDHPDNIALHYMTTAQIHLTKLTNNGQIAHAMEHVVGRLSLGLTKEDKKEITQLIHDFRKGLLPRSAPLTLLNHHLKKLGADTPMHSKFISPIPLSMGLMARV